MLYLGKEVLVRENEDDTWKMHFFRYKGKTGYHTEEGGATAYKYIYVGPDMFKKMGTKNHILDGRFEEIILGLWIARKFK